MTGQLRTVVVGDALLPTGLITAALDSLSDRVDVVATLSWGPPDQAEVDRMALNLERHGPEAEPPPEELAEVLAEAEAAIVHYCPVPAALLERAPELRILATCRAGLENLAAREAADRGVLVLHAIGRTTEAVSDFAIGLLLAEARNIARAHDRLMAGRWNKEFRNSPFTPELEGKTVGIVGFGEIGRAVARKLSGFRVELLAHDPYVDHGVIRRGGAEPVALDVLLDRSDFVTLHARPEPAAPPLIGRDELARMKPTAILVNTARAALVDEEALLDALREGLIGGAAMDVHHREPLGPDHPLLSLDNVTLTPHLASSTRECSEKSPRIVAEELRLLLEGSAPRYAVNPEAVTGAQAAIAGAGG
jgi:D-3-phosphoglycerate dehydrogenase / 2-oxoglutarate reductase